MEEHGFVHKSVLLYETVGSLNIKPGGIYVDGTLGGGGHAYEVCKRLGGGRLIGIDQDADAIRAAGERLAPFKDKVTIVRSNYQNIENVLKELNIEKVDGIYLDLGVFSSSSSFDGRIGFRVITLPILFLPHTHTGKSGGQMHGFSLVRNLVFTILSSKEWKVMILNLPSGFKRRIIVSIEFSSTSSS